MTGILILIVTLNLFLSQQIQEIDIGLQSWQQNITQRKTNSTNWLKLSKGDKRFVLIELFVISKSSSSNLMLLQSFNVVPYFNNSTDVKKIVCDNADQNGKYLAKKYHYIVLDKPNVTEFTTFVTVLTNTTTAYTIMISSTSIRPCPNHCNRNGRCNDEGICQCDKGFIDEDCSQTGAQVFPYKNFSQSLEWNKPMFLYSLMNYSIDCKLIITVKSNSQKEEKLMLIQLKLSLNNQLPSDFNNNYNSSIKIGEQLQLNFKKEENQNNLNNSELSLVIKLHHISEQDTNSTYQIFFSIEDLDDIDNQISKVIIIITVISAVFLLGAILIIKRCREKKRKAFMKIPRKEELNYIINQDAMICSICLERLLKKEKLAKPQQCQHYFHYQCLSMWLNYQQSCPICRNNSEC